MKCLILILTLIFSKTAFSQNNVINESVLADFFNRREITPKYEVDQMNIRYISKNIGIWAPQDLKVLLNDSIVNRGDIGIEQNEKRRYLERNLHKDDFEYIEKQLLDTAGSDKWFKNIYKNKSLIDLSSYENGKMWIYTKPLFNHKKSFCLLKISYYCGNSCAFSRIYSYKKDANSNWVIDSLIYSYVPWSDYQLLPKQALNVSKRESVICNSEDSLFLEEKVIISDKRQVYDFLCRSSSEDIDWPSDEIKMNSGICSSNWESLNNGDSAIIIWRFKSFKSSRGDYVYIIKLNDYYVPINCSGLASAP